MENKAQIKLPISLRKHYSICNYEDSLVKNIRLIDSDTFTKFVPSVLALIAHKFEIINHGFEVCSFKQGISNLCQMLEEKISDSADENLNNLMGLLKKILDEFDESHINNAFMSQFNQRKIYINIDEIQDFDYVKMLEAILEAVSQYSSYKLSNDIPISFSSQLICEAILMFAILLTEDATVEIGLVDIITHKIIALIVDFITDRWTIARLKTDGELMNQIYRQFPQFKHCQNERQLFENNIVEKMKGCHQLAAYLPGLYFIHFDDKSRMKSLYDNYARILREQELIMPPFDRFYNNLEITCQDLAEIGQYKQDFLAFVYEILQSNPKLNLKSDVLNQFMN